MPKLKTHKGIKKRFKVSATGKVSHKKCGSSHLMSHKSGKQVRRLRKKVQLKVLAEARRIRKAVHTKPGANYTELEAIRLGIVAEEAAMAAEVSVDPATLPSEA
jgi:large subunit ribosomal protein L35